MFGDQCIFPWRDSLAQTRRFASLALIIGLCASSNAFAADLGVPQSDGLQGEAMPPAVMSWRGFYLGVHGGYGASQNSSGDGGTQISNPPYGAFSCGPALTGNYCATPFELEKGGWLGGVQLGYNIQRGNVVVGFEGDLGWLNIGGDETLIRPFNDRDYLSVDYGGYGVLALRLGYALDRALIYAKGGLALAQINTAAADIDLGGNGFEIYQGSLTSTKGWETGWALGGGIEYAVTSSLSLKAEYLYMDFGKHTSTSPDGDIYAHENAVHTVKVGLNYFLNGGDDEALK
jgi:outer membrane immunogenic protein